MGFWVNFEVQMGGPGKGWVGWGLVMMGVGFYGKGRRG